MGLLFQLDGILFGFLLLSSSSVFQSAAVPGGRNSISPPSPSPVRQTVKKPILLDKSACTISLEKQ
jgi:hypothetical protein